MPVPAATVFERLGSFAAVDSTQEHAGRAITEVFTGETLGTVPVGTGADVALAMTKARAAQAEWADRTPKQRAEVLERYRALVVENREFLMDIVQAETGKARWAAQEEIMGLMCAARYFSRVAPQLLAPHSAPGAFPVLNRASVRAVPKGVVGVIAPWNYPMLLSVGDSIPALLAGNAVVVKPDSQTPYSSLANAELFVRAGLPRDLFAVVPGPGTVVGTAIVEQCDYLMFTGSSATGRTLAEQCGRRLIGFSAELGGKNPMIVARGADLDKAAKAAVRACFSNAGQLCISIERMYVERAVADEFTTKFVAAVKAAKLGAAYDFSTDIGSLISESQLETVTKHVADAVSKGAKVLAGGNPRPDLGPLFFEPTVLSDVTDAMECGRNETFGPLVSIYPVDSVAEAIIRANDTEYGLNASVWASSKAEGERIAQQLHAGTVNIDEGYAPAWGTTGAPMGGMGISGVGRRHGPDGLLKFTEPQAIVVTRFLNLDAPSFIPQDKWPPFLMTLARSFRFLPGR
ncbi:succinic semialdehyde dehydrogenase [Nocardia seriolae]|uniref:succinate-semialdehyde dehydrogenase (NADP(+)) n=1 Tax=Nocardia seriolae TaxID=37332 RepID=A0A0B8NDY0_9NOCA|nr:succinic semialdehyde dehydrogenase [Nocardia seriolae]MTJ63728.1 aldehyde dehydrogenase family protein [Nocardia seriolae]MTJ75549.1 aldehyde dehydrogenase family protein [Nocardia seriolae]MTJ88295.1 aldehyde dehydrogenase family protein [Nocardia seriolae]MTK32281.1 aldehyde dehydrogenase family protein [Nocardia seriolae]MTK41618.1 aldehyde dehydrogenase family protein [Nocardia seriolae]